MGHIIVTQFLSLYAQTSIPVVVLNS